MTTSRVRSADGRVARGERTREAIVEAHTALLREGVLRPTGKLIAERAGISLRTLWLNFNDLESMLEATTAHWLAADVALARRVDPTLPLEQRVDAYVEQCVARLEHVAPAARSAVLGEPFSPALARSRAVRVQRAQQELAAVFATELEAAGDGRATLAQALFVATTWPSWLGLRDDLGLDVDAATAVMRRSLLALLT